MPVLFPGSAPAPHIRVFAAGHLRLDSWWPNTDRLRSFWRMYYHSSEGVQIQLGKNRFDMPAERLVLIPAGLEFDIGAVSHVQQTYLYFELVGWPAAATNEMLSAPAVLEPDVVRDLLFAKIREDIIASPDLDPVRIGRMKALLHLALAEVLDNLPTERARRFLRVADGQRELLAVLSYIDEHIEEPLPNVTLASVAGISEGRFIRRFREATGLTPARYVQEQRVRRSAELLVSGDESIDRIAERCGFGNRYYFTRVFARRMGIPPARYRSDEPYLAEARQQET